QGHVRNQESPIAYATVELFSAKDSASIKTVMTDVTGFFKIDSVHTGVYQLRITAVGFESTIESVEIKENKNETRNVVLNTSAKQLSAVTVTSQRKSIEVH